MFGILGITDVPGGGSNLKVTTAPVMIPPCALATRPLTDTVCADTAVEAMTNARAARRRLSISITSPDRLWSSRSFLNRNRGGERLYLNSF